jgi:hypothetical protein
LPRLQDANCALAHVSAALRAYDGELELVGHREGCSAAETKKSTMQTRTTEW